MSNAKTASDFYRDWYRQKVEEGDWHLDLNEQDTADFAEMLDAYAAQQQGLD